MSCGLIPCIFLPVVTFNFQNPSCIPKLAQHAYEDSRRMQLGFCKLKVTAGKGIGPYGMLNESDQPTQFRQFIHLNPPYQQ
jgi:hypothetical protein